MAKSVKVHDDTHRALKKMKVATRSASMDQVIRKMIRDATGSEPGSAVDDPNTDRLTEYLDE